MKNLKYTEILLLNEQLKNRLKGDIYEIHILSNIVVNQLKEILEYSLRMSEINASVNIGDYDNIVQNSSQYKASRAVILFWELANLIDGFQYKANIMGTEEIEALVQKTKAEIDYIFHNLQETSLVIINKFSTLLFNHKNIRADKFDEVCETLNRYLEEKHKSNMILIDIDRIIASLSVDASCDFRYYYSSKALYSAAFFKEYSAYIRPVFLSANGKQKKAIILDCDNTLWKGTIGEDGPQGIEMSAATSKGVIFEEIQSILLNLNKKAVLLGICSKNNLADVEDVISNHPHMKIREENIAIKKVNWQDKVTNLKDIAQELNIGLDSLVFLDDSDFEVNYMRQELTEVESLQVPQRLSDYPALLRECSGLFFSLAETKEDANKTKAYKEQYERESFKKGFDNLEDYLKSLALRITVHTDHAEAADRLSQITQKTNQFNLMTKRYTETDIMKFIKDDKYSLLDIEVSDKFGSYGITGFAIIELDRPSKKAAINTLLLSCRILGRNIEFAFMDLLIAYLESLGICEISAKYIKTQKNEQTAYFFDKCGFDILEHNEENKQYNLCIEKYKKFDLKYIEVQYEKRSN